MASVPRGMPSAQKLRSARSLRELLEQLVPKPVGRQSCLLLPSGPACRDTSQQLGHPTVSSEQWAIRGSCVAVGTVGSLPVSGEGVATEQQESRKRKPRHECAVLTPGRALGRTLSCKGARTAIY